MKKLSIIFLLLCSLFLLGGCGRDTSTVENSLIGHWKAHTVKMSGTNLAGKDFSIDVPQKSQTDMNYYIGKQTVYFVDDKGTKSQYNYKISKSNEQENTLTLSPIIDSTNTMGVDRNFTFPDKSRTKATVTFNLGDIVKSTSTDKADNSWALLQGLLGSSNGQVTEEWTYIDDKQTP